MRQDSTNTGCGNSGYCNSGDYNSGHYNWGYRNSGNRNSGNYNSENSNSGDFNSGRRNSGSYNSGRSNSGNCNSGNCNSGYRNSGDFNSGDWNSGYFNTTTPELIQVFDGAMVDRKKFFESLPAWVVEDVRLNVWVEGSDMSDQELTEFPEYETLDGYLKTRTLEEAFAAAWENSDHNVEEVRGILGFDEKVWVKITGIELGER